MFNISFYLICPFVFYSDRHSVSGLIAVAAKSHFGLSAASGTSYACHTSLPDQDPRNKVGYGADNVRYKSTPPPSYNTIMAEEPPVNFAFPSSQNFTSFDANAASHSPAESTDARNEVKLTAKIEVMDLKMHQSQNKECVSKEVLKSGRKSACSMDNPKSSSSSIGFMNGSLVPGLESVNTVPVINCPVEQAEEIIGTEATSLSIGFGMGLRLSDEARLEDYRCIPVDHAIAVECDEQVLGELDMAGFEEFSRRIYALNENTSSFRRPRKGSDK